MRRTRRIPRDSYVAFPIHLAARGGHHETIQVLIQRGALASVPSVGLWQHRNTLVETNLDVFTKVVLTPIHFSIQSRNLQSIDLFMHSGSLLTEKRHKITIFHCAAGFADAATVDFLLEKLKSYAHVQPTDSLLAACPLHYPDARGQSPLFYAHMYENFALIEHLICSGADVDGGAGDAHSPLVAACIVGDFELGRMLINRGANVNMRCRRGKTTLSLGGRRCDLYGLRPLDICCRTGHAGSSKFVAQLLAAGAKIRHPDGYTRDSSHPAVAAAACHQPEILHELLRQESDILGPFHRSTPETPLVAAIAYRPFRRVVHHGPQQRDDGVERMLECVSVLLKHGADPSQSDRKWQDAFDALLGSLKSGTRETPPAYCEESTLSESTALQIVKLFLAHQSRAAITHKSPATNLLKTAFVKCSYSFCMAVIQHGARLSAKPDQLKDCWELLFSAQPKAFEYDSLDDDRDIAMLDMGGDESTRYGQALKVMAAMDSGSRLGREPYFLAKAMAAPHGRDPWSLFIIEHYKDHIPALLQQSYKSRSMLERAVRSGSPAILNALLAKCSDTNTFILTAEGMPLLHIAIEGHFQSAGSITKVSAVARTLLERGFPVHYATVADSGTVRLSTDANLNFRMTKCTAECMEWNQSPLRSNPVALAVRQQNFEQLDFLLSCTPLTNDVPSECHFVYLSEACSEPRLRMLRLLLAWGADPNALDSSTGDTALLSLLRRMDAATAECILHQSQYPADVQLRNTDDPRDWLCHWVECVSVFLQQQGSMAQKSRQGLQVVDYVNKILKYEGTRWFRVFLKHQASKRWVVTGDEDSSARIVKVLEDGGSKDYLKAGPANETYHWLMLRLGAEAIDDAVADENGEDDDLHDSQEHRDNSWDSDFDDDFM